MKIIIINDNESLLAACNILHGASFDLASLTHNKDQCSCSMTFEREYFEDPSLIRGETIFFIFDRTSIPIAESILTINGIKSIEITDKARIDRYTFNECSIQDNILTFLFSNRTIRYYEEIEIVITLNQQPNGSMVDQELLDKSHHFYSLRFLRLRPFSKS